MKALAWIFAVLAAITYLVVFVFEVFLLERRAVYEGIFRMPAEDVRGARLWAFGAGFYNLFLGSGAIIGVVLWATESETAGRTLVIFTCVCMVLAGFVLIAADRMALGRPRGAGLSGAVAAGGPALIALLATLAA